MRMMLTTMAWAAGVFLLAASAPAGDQPQWGQAWSRNMVSAEKGLPGRIDPADVRGIRWIAKLGTQAHGTPIVAGGRVYIGTNNSVPRDPKHKGDRGVLMCLDEKDGSLLWQLVVPKRSEDQFFDWPEMGLCATATVEGDRVYIVTNRAEVMCLDVHGMANGNDGPYVDEGRRMAPKGEPAMEPGKTDADIIWAVDMMEELGVWQHDGPQAAPLVDGPYVYVNSCNGVDNTHRVIRKPEAPSLVVLEKATGRLVATDGQRMSPRTVHATWASPSKGVVDGRELIFFGGGDGVCYAFEALPKDAVPKKPVALKLAWKFDCDPAAPGDDRHQYMGNRRTSASNILGMPVFHDGKVYVAAGGDIWWGKRLSWLRCLDAATGAEVWKHEINNHCVATPAIADGLIYVTDLGRRIHCIDLASGQTVWTHATRGEFWASVLVADGKVYAGTRRGDFWVLKAGREKTVLSECHLGAAISGTATAANGVVYVATMTHLYAFGAAQGE